VPADGRFLERGLLADLEEVAPFDPLKKFVPRRDWGRTYSRFLRKEVRTKGGHFLVAEVGSKRAGFVVGVLERLSRAVKGKRRARRPCRILDLYVAPAFRNRGVGGRLMDEVERRLRAHRRDFVQMLSLSGNERAIAMYHARGYISRVHLLGKWLVEPA
jgi:ribosomal protein S18 acetylase RimI-like enzyme